MTSVERIDSDIYPAGGLDTLVKEPPYSVLSYTWGRYEKRPRRPEYERLQISGIDWEIPPIAEAHFSVQDFETVIEELRRHHDFAWIDIACIHQEDEILKAAEIGQQARIFANARSAFIWLCRTPGDIHERILRQTWSLWEMYWEDAQEDFVFDAGVENRFIEVLDAAMVTITEISQDPYFSSLWTLQEYLYRPGASIIYAEPGVHSSFSLSLGHLNQMMAFQSSEAIQNRVKSIINITGRMGYAPASVPLYSNPHQSRAAAGYRTASIEQDRIFATMSAYRVVTQASKGMSRRNPYSYSMAELRHAFATTLNEISPSLGQSFIHPTRPAPGESWKLPAQLSNYNNDVWAWDWRHFGPLSSISGTEHGYAIFEGDVGRLSALLEAAATNHFEDRLPTLVLDDYLFSEHQQLSAALAARGDASIETFTPVIGAAVLQTFGDEEVHVLALATCPADNGIQPFQYLVLRRLSHHEERYERLGITYTWPKPDIDWKRVRGQLH